MKSITVTTQNAINYGAVLQAYALQTVQRSMGIDNYLLNIRTENPIFTPIQLKLSRETAIRFVLNAGNLLRYKSISKQRDSFKKFKEENLFLTDEFYDTNSVIKNPPSVDYMVTGSDQVFEIRSEEDPVRMLQFGNETVKRFSFAASLGEYDWNESEKAIFKEQLERFDAVSVREKYAKEYIESFSNIQCEIHLDPVFLLDKTQWDNVIANIKPIEKYILCFPLLGNEKLQEAVNELKRKTGYKVYCIQTNPIKRIKADKYIYDAGPSEFLAYLKYSEAVITTSFHGTAFSILFEKPFYTLIKNYKSQRMTDLLELLNLSGRTYKKPEEVTLDIDYLYAKETILKERNRSLDYLRRIVEICGGNSCNQ